MGLDMLGNLGRNAPASRAPISNRLSGLEQRFLEPSLLGTASCLFFREMRPTRLCQNAL